LRRSGDNEGAWKILKAAPTEAELLISPDQWWLERRAAAYAALRAGSHETAYELVRKGGPLSINPMKEQAHLAGWIALRLLEKPELALPHLQAARDAADGPLSKSRGNYWLGRALEVLGREAEARKHYETAALVFDTFHGQLARHKLGPEGPLAFSVGLPALPSDAEARRFVELDAVRGAVIATKAGLDRSIRQNLFGHLRNHLEREGDMAMLAHLAASLGDIQTSLRVGKAGIGRGMNLAVYAYPVQAFPDYKPLREPPETAILLGIARQETEFNSSIVSSAGARGLLQVMPITARHVCKDHKVQCDIPRLLSDDAYNASISSAYIGDRMAEFRGSYVLTLAGYNAGPGRARQWVRELGDPRDPAVDVIDWIERIPIEETREYVKKVLSNIQVYRARLSMPKPLRLAEDLSRRTEGRRQAARNEGDATVKSD
jgi:soluble lytic murein transglycosylase